MTRQHTSTRNDDRRSDTVVDEPIMDHRETAGTVSERVTTRGDSWSMARGGMRMFNSLIAFVLLLVETLLAFRLGFALGGANRANGFVEFIYDFSKPFVAPFKGIFAHDVSGKTVFEPETVIAMVVWAVLAVIIVVAVNILMSAPSPTNTKEVTREQRTHFDRSL
jgi:hypothetical protein